MTTSVDILFKELPAMSRADERISRPDASSIGSDEGRDRSYVSKREKEKSFEDYIEERDVSDKRPLMTKEKSKVRSIIADDNQLKEQTSRLGETSTTKETEKNSISALDKNNPQGNENNTETVKVVDETNEVLVSVNNIKTEDKAPSFTTKDLMLTETTAEKSALQNNINNAQSILKPNTANIPDQSIASSASLKNNPDQSSNQQFEQNTSANNGEQATQSNIKEAAPHNNPFLTAASDNLDDKISTITNRSSSNIETKTLIKETPLSSSETSTIVKPEQILPNDFNLEAKVVNENTIQLSDDSANQFSNDLNKANVNSTNNIFEKKLATNSEPTIVLPINNEIILNEIDSIIGATANTMNDVINNAELMQKPAPQPDTVAVEATKTLPFAVTQNPNNISKSSNNSKKTGSSVASVNSATNQSNANKAQSTAQNNIAQTMLQNAQKSDIQIDLGLNGQKFDAPHGQTMSPSGQTSLPGNSVLAAQDVSFQKTLSALSTTKTDVPMNAKMINEQITVAINKNVVKGLNNFSIRLHPAELGQVDIKLEFAADGKMHAAMMVENEKTLTMLQRDQATLEKALQDAGINLSNKNMNFSLMKQNQENNANKFAGGIGSTKIDNEIDELTELGTMQDIRMSYSNQALDISV